MKSYTDLKQSENLSNILPLTSADMHYERAYFEGKQSDWFIALGRPIKSDDIIPCWSLAALFKMLPYSARLERGSSTELCYVTLPNELESSDWYIEPIDAVFEMILKLYELKML